jgi:hypothetical protein
VRRVKRLTMPVPAVSEENWQLTRAFSKIYMGTEYMSPDDLSFEGQLELIVEAEKRSDKTLMEEKRREMFDRSQQAWPLADGVVVGYHVKERDHPRRPEVSEDVLEDLTDVLMENFEGLPIDEMSFDKKLEMLYGLLSDVAPEYNVEVVRKETFESETWPDNYDLVVV